MNDCVHTCTELKSLLFCSIKLVYLLHSVCDASERTSHKSLCSVCVQLHESDVQPPFKNSLTGDQDILKHIWPHWKGKYQTLSARCLCIADEHVVFCRSRRQHMYVCVYFSANTTVWVTHWQMRLNVAQLCFNTDAHLHTYARVSNMTVSALAGWLIVTSALTSADWSLNWVTTSCVCAVSAVVGLHGAHKMMTSWLLLLLYVFGVFFYSLPINCLFCFS